MDEFRARKAKKDRKVISIAEYRKVEAVRSAA